MFSFFEVTAVQKDNNVVSHRFPCKRFGSASRKFSVILSGIYAQKGKKKISKILLMELSCLSLSSPMAFGAGIGLEGRREST